LLKKCLYAITQRGESLDNNFRSQSRLSERSSKLPRLRWHLQTRRLPRRRTQRRPTARQLATVSIAPAYADELAGEQMG